MARSLTDTTTTTSTSSELEVPWCEEEEKTVQCLFGGLSCEKFLTVKDAIHHCKEVHGIDFLLVKSKLDMHQQSYIKMVNYIRTYKTEPEQIMAMQSDSLWQDEKFMKPVHIDEWLYFDIESLRHPDNQPMKMLKPPNSYLANVENGLVTLDQNHFSELQETIHTLTTQLNESKTFLHMANEDIKKMRDVMKRLVDTEDFNSPSGSNQQVPNCVSNVALEDDEGYFSTYSHFGIHYDMLSDKVRTESYRDAILNNSDMFKDKVVLDLGCGTGILSMFSATAGAKKVYAIDQSEIIYHAIDIIHENNLQNVIKPIKGRLEETILDSKMDIIVSEWMGYFLLFEGMLDSVIYARDKHLMPGGMLLPNKCEISIVASGDTDTHNKLINYWSDVYGYKMNCMKSEVVREASIDIVEAKHLISTPFVIKTIDIMICQIDTMDFTSEFELIITKDGYITSLVGYFDTFFDLPNYVSFSTGPHTPPTHWKQTIFYFKDCKKVKKGDVINGKIICSRQKSDVRALSVQINIFGENHKYILN